MLKILITGGNGLLGQNLIKVLSGKYHIASTGLEDNSIGLIDPDLYVQADLSKKDSVIELIKKTEPELIINCAAITNVDLCETKPVLAEMVNIAGVANLLEVSSAKMIHISTDYVFNGDSGPYSEENETDPISIYGITKLQAELAVMETSKNNLLIRSCVIFGTGVGLNVSFIDWVKNSLKEKKEIKIVDDQISNTTLASNLSKNIKVLLDSNKNGIWHVAGSEITSRFDMAHTIAKTYNLDSSLIKSIKTKELNQDAARPLNGGLLVSKVKEIDGIKLIDFKEQLYLYMEEQNG